MNRPNTAQPLTSHETAILEFLQRRPFSRQYEISDSLRLPGDHNNWLTFTGLRSLQARGLVTLELVPSPTGKSKLKIWRPIDTQATRTKRETPRKRDTLRRFFSLFGF
jgi:hypothetical protein